MTAHLAPSRAALNAAERLVVAAISAAAAVAIALDAEFVGAFGPARLFLVLVALLGILALLQGRLRVGRETKLYAAFVGYLVVASFWAPDRTLTLNTLFPSINFLLIMVLYESLCIHAELRTVLAGTLAGSVLGALIYASIVGFPFVRPEDFSYNAMAAMYLFGLFCSLAYGWARGVRVLPLALGSIFMLHVLATTSIKTNLGIALGAAVAGLFYLRYSLRLLSRSLLAILVVGAVLAYVVVSDRMATQDLDAGVARVSLGLKVLETEQDEPGYSAFGDRQHWIQVGLEGWKYNPLFGHGTESFRFAYGITSHCTPVELLYNTGVIGFTLFYAVFASLALRLLNAKRWWPRTPLALIMATLVCTVFVTLSGTVFYLAFTACFLALSAAMLRTLEHASGLGGGRVASNSQR